MAVLFDPHFQAMDANGLPMSGAKLFFYQAGTSTLIPIYQDADASTPHTNPVVAPASGTFAPIYISPGTSVKFVLKTAGDVTVQTVDDAVFGSLPGSDFENLADAESYEPAVAPDTIRLLGYYSAGDGGGALYVKAGSEPSHDGKFSLTTEGGDETWYEIAEVAIWAEMFGARASGNPSHDDANSTSIQAAVDYVKSVGGGWVFFNAGEYCIDLPVVWPDEVGWWGKGPYATIFTKTTNTPSPVADPLSSTRWWNSIAVTYPICCFHLTGDGVNWSGTGRGAQFRGNGDYSGTVAANTSTVEFGIYAPGISNGHIKNNYFNGLICGAMLGDRSSIYSTIDDGNVFGDCHYGLAIKGSSTSLGITGNFFKGNRYNHFYISSDTFLYAHNAHDSGGAYPLRLSAAEFFTAVRLNGARGATLASLDFEANNGRLLDIRGCTKPQISRIYVKSHKSDYTGNGAMDPMSVVYLDGNVSREFTKSTFIMASGDMTGTASLHRNLLIGSNGDLGDVVDSDIGFYNTAAEEGGADTGWSGGSFAASSVRRSAKGQFTATLTGVSGTVTGTVKWSYSGGVVTLEIPDIQGTSTSTSATLTGMPSAIAPATAQYAFGAVLDDGTSVYIGRWIVNSGSGVISLAPGFSLTGFTAANAKGTEQCTLSYRIF